MIKIESISYEQARSDFLKAEMEKAQNRMKFWQTKIKKAKNAIAEMEAHDKACNAGWEYNFYKDALEALNAQPKWISVEERLPEAGCVVLAVIMGAVTLLWHVGDGHFRTGNGILWRKEEGHITYWMPLPEPPKEDGNEN